MQEVQVLDARFLHKAARKVLGANVTLRIEALLFLADMATPMNLYILENANVLHRSLRAEGAAAQINAKEEIWARYKSHDMGTSDDQDSRGSIIVWEPEKIQIKELRRYNGTTMERIQEKEGNAWEITNRTGGNLENTVPQNSLYYTTEESVSDSQIRDRLIYDRRKGDDGIGAAISALTRTGWKPEVTFSQGKYIRQDKKEQIYWWKLHKARVTRLRDPRGKKNSISR